MFRSFLELFIILPSVVLLVCACASRSEIDSILAESSLGAVYLERMVDPSFQVAHPIQITPDTIGRVLRGIIVTDNQRGLKSVLAGPSAPASAFTQDEIRFLAPVLARGLREAAADQQISFRLIQVRPPSLPGSAGAGVGSSEPLQLSLPETTSGAIYAYGRSLYITVREFRHRQEAADMIHMPNRRVRNPGGLSYHRFSFIPEVAARPESYYGKSDDQWTIAIDHELLATLPVAPISLTSQQQSTEPLISTTTEAGGSGREAQLESLEKQMRQKNVELEELRKELQEIRRQLKQPSSNPAPSAP